MISMRRDKISATRMRAMILRVLMSGASIPRLRTEVLGFERLYCGTLCVDQVGGKRLEKQTPPPWMVVSGVTQVEDSVTTICVMSSYMTAEFNDALPYKYVSN
jgi:hypothetical protein